MSLLLVICAILTVCLFSCAQSDMPGNGTNGTNGTNGSTTGNGTVTDYNKNQNGTGSGQVNSNNGRADGGKGDAYDDTDMDLNGAVGDAARGVADGVRDATNAVENDFGVTSKTAGGNTTANN